MDITKILDQDRIEIIEPIMGSEFADMSDMVSKVDTIEEANAIIRDWVHMYGIVTIAFAPRKWWKSGHENDPD